MPRPRRLLAWRVLPIPSVERGNHLIESSYTHRDWEAWTFDWNTDSIAQQST
ncbi:hypothetical protein NC653_016979 [Populus alba x Populus x berolinensis]|uniref:Uncharacterized protein n=1 Tax=Populus alba x Populus x berolinensis TaxID=444605 RepID=A0AAD6QPA7_9ROSI|nr:hypothetical protein NC653_016979 [Populus alba x Populus x berolinensis]